jgi:hypothetical protein
MGGLHCISHHADQLAAQQVQVRLVAELGREGIEGLPRVDECILMAAGHLDRKQAQVGSILRYRAMTNMKAP